MSKYNYQFEVKATYTQGGAVYSFGAMTEIPVGSTCLAQTRADSLGIVKVISCEPYDAEVKRPYDLRLIYDTVQSMRKFLDNWANDPELPDPFFFRDLTKVTQPISGGNHAA
jgi:hypothetical protein